LKDDEIVRLKSFLEFIEVADLSVDAGRRIDPDTWKLLRQAPEAWAHLYEENKEDVRSLIEGDPSGKDLVALSRRRRDLESFGQMLSEGVDDED